MQSAINPIALFPVAIRKPTVMTIFIRISGIIPIDRKIPGNLKRLRVVVDGRLSTAFNRLRKEGKWWGRLQQLPGRNDIVEDIPFRWFFAKHFKWSDRRSAIGFGIFN